MSKPTKQESLLWAEQDGIILLRGVRCDVCNALLFPPQSFGCEACGAHGSHLVEEMFPSQGQLHTFATVHIHPELTTPYAIAEVKTAASQRVRGRLIHPHPTIGDAVIGHVNRDHGAPQLVFVPMTPETNG